MSQKLMVLTTVSDAITAHSIRILLEASGLQVFVTGDRPSEHASDQVHVYVRKEDFEVARQIIDEVPSASEVLIPEWTCRCGATVDAGFHCCWACGAEHEDV